jgi:outer membrane protein assembly factor BamC
LETTHVSSCPPNPLRALAAALTSAFALGGCSTIQDALGGERIDYRSQASKTATLEVPPDLSQLAKDSRYQPQAGSVSASAMQQAPVAAAAAAPTVVPVGDAKLRVERQGLQRWLVTALPPEQLWPQLRAFWQERGFAIGVDNPEIGLMETDWAENRAKLPRDGVRRLVGGVLDSLYDTGERDKFRTRVERTAGGSEIFITHRGMEEVLQGNLKDTAVWTRRPADPELEAEMLARLMVKLGAREDTARSAVSGPAAAAPAAARARATTQGTLEVDESFDRAWRRVGLALDRSGFTVEDRDRANGLYYVRYIDPKTADKDEPGFFARLFGRAEDPGQVAARQRYRVSLKAVGDKTEVAVLNAQGATDAGGVGKRIVSMLVDELR